MLTLAEPDLVESDCKTAVTVTVGGLGTELGAVYKPEALIVPNEAFPPVIKFTCQLTAELPAFCTVAVNGTLEPVKGCAEAGDTVTVTDGGEPEEATPPHEIRNIFSRRRTRKRNERPEHNGDNDRTYRGRWITPALPREDWFRGCKSNGVRIGSAESREVPGDSAEVTTT
jgi:hypothetical protein